MKSKNLIDSFKYAFEGIFTAIKKEKNIKIHVFIMILVIIAGIVLKISKFEWIICIILFGIVIAGEMFNSTIETIIDMVMPNKNDMAKKAKDISAGAVLILSISAAVVGIIIFLEKLCKLW